MALRPRYEDILADPATELERIGQFVEFDVEPAMLAGGFKLPKFTQKQHRLVAAAPDQKRAEAWRTSLSADQVAQFEGVARDVLPVLGHALTTRAEPVGLGTVAGVCAQLWAEARKGANVDKRALRGWRHTPRGK